MVENSAEQEEQCILDTYEPAPVYESDPDGGNIQDIAVVSYQAALEVLELLRLFSSSESSSIYNEISR